MYIIMLRNPYRFHESNVLNGLWQDISEFKSLRQELRKRMDGKTLHLRKLSGSRAAFQTFVEETIRAGGQEMLDYHALPRGVSLVTFETRRTALEALTLLQSQLDNELVQFRFDMIHL